MQLIPNPFPGRHDAPQMPSDFFEKKVVVISGSETLQTVDSREVVCLILKQCGFTACSSQLHLGFMGCVAPIVSVWLG